MRKPFIGQGGEGSLHVKQMARITRIYDIFITDYWGYLIKTFIRGNAVLAYTPYLTRINRFKQYFLEKIYNNYRRMG